MRFTWKGLLLAPLPLPFVLSAVMAPMLQGEGPVVLPFLILLIPACLISYATTIFLFLPALFVLALLRPVAGWMAGLLGFVLGAALIVPVTLMAWKGSGPVSGPPTESFLTFFERWATDPLMLVFPIAGFVTANLYWWFGKRQRSRAIAPGAATN
jgi:hypothetical protein